MGGVESPPPTLPILCTRDVYTATGPKAHSLRPIALTRPGSWGLTPKTRIVTHGQCLPYGRVVASPLSRAGARRPRGRLTTSHHRTVSPADVGLRWLTRSQRYRAGMPVTAHDLSRRLRASRVTLIVLAAVSISGCGHSHRPGSAAAPDGTSASVAGGQVNTPAGRPATRSSAASASAGQRPRSVTILGSGDVLIHPPLWEQAAADAKAAGRTGYDFGPIYAGVAPVSRAADLAICEMETPLAPPQGPFAGWPNFNAPPQVLTALKAAGYDSCTTASNHTLDQGYAGVKRTLDELDAAGLAHTGSARSAAEAARPLVTTTRAGVRVAQLAFAFGFNGIPLPATQRWLANLTEVPTILAAAHRAKQSGADIVVLSMHWGVEYDHAATAEQTSEADRLLASPDIDVILGDHAHVVQPFQKLHGKWVAYCMGNQISRHAQPISDNREGVMPRFTFTEVAPHRFAVTKAEAIATWMQMSPRLRLIALGPALKDPMTTTGSRAPYRAAFSRISGYVNALGAEREGLRVG
jgi:hypothetical protein